MEACAYMCAHARWGGTPGSPSSLGEWNSNWRVMPSDCIDMDIDMCMGMCIDMRLEMCIDVFMDMT